MKAKYFFILLGCIPEIAIAQQAPNAQQLDRQVIVRKIPGQMSGMVPETATSTPTYVQAAQVNSMTNTDRARITSELAKSQTAAIQSLSEELKKVNARLDKLEQQKR